MSNEHFISSFILCVWTSNARFLMNKRKQVGRVVEATQNAYRLVRIHLNGTKVSLCSFFTGTCVYVIVKQWFSHLQI